MNTVELIKKDLDEDLKDLVRDNSSINTDMFTVAIQILRCLRSIEWEIKEIRETVNRF